MESKIKNVIINAPVHAHSFYGTKSRELIKTILKLRPNWSVKIYNYNENRTRNDFIDNEIDNLIVNQDQSTPDIWIQIGHPSGYKRKGIKNIGVVYSYNFEPIDVFVSGCNNMDYIITYSNYSADTIQKFNVRENNKVTTPIIVLPEYSLISIDNELSDASSSNTLLSDVQTNWNFLVDGYWETEDPVTFGGRNKDNIGFIITNFLSVFSNTDINVGLILKVHGDIPSILDRMNLEKKINDIWKTVKGNPAKIYLINGDLTRKDTVELYSDPKIKALISIPQRSDSVQSDINFAFATGRPIIYSNHAAQKEYLSYEGNIAINGNIKQINGGGPLIVDSFASDLKLGMYEMYLHYNDYVINSYNNSRIMNNIFTKDNYMNKLNNFLEKLF